MIIALSLVLVLLAGRVSGRTFCYAGSDMYQLLTQDCNAQDPTYTGDWYCSSISVCESFISGSRNCMQTRGCAKEAQCYTTGSKSTGSLYTGIALTNSGTELPSGMSIEPTCCLNDVAFADDDSGLDYDNICNSASKNIGISIALISCLVAAVSVYLM
jgi:hypothetical protein